MLVKSLSQLQILPHMSVHFCNWDFALVSWLSQKNLSIYRHFKKTQKWYALYNTVATVTRKLFFVVWHWLVIYIFFLQMMDMSDSQLVIIGIKCVQKKIAKCWPNVTIKRPDRFQPLTPRSKHCRFWYHKSQKLYFICSQSAGFIKENNK
jgi:hypothetical protein